jgi:hypothetical protein
MDCFHHPFEYGVEELARVLGIAVGQQFHRALEVGEEHGHLLALALEGGLGREDPLSEVLGGIRLRGLKLRRCASDGAERLSAAAAELIVGIVGEPARGADDREGRRAFGAEASVVAILRLTPKAGDHRSSAISASACSSQNRMSISRYIVAAVVRCFRA